MFGKGAKTTDLMLPLPTMMTPISDLYVATAC